MTERQEHRWHFELYDMRARLRYALDNLDSTDKRTYVRHEIEQVRSRLNELFELTKGEEQ